MRRVALCAILGAALTVAAAAPAAALIRIRDVGVGDYPLVSIAIATKDQTPVSLGGVHVNENGVPVDVEEVTPLSDRAGKVDVVLAIDVSNSMRGLELDTALAAAQAFVQQTPESIDVGVLAFAETSDVVAPVTGERVTTASAVSSLDSTTSQGTSLFDAVVTASEMFEGAGQHNLVLLTDGRNTAGEASAADAIAAASSSGVTVYPLGLEGGDPDAEVLSDLAEATGGRFRILSPADLGAAYRGLANQLARQYVVTYRSKSPPGTQASVVVSTPAGSAEISVLMPAPAITAATRNDAILGGLLQGDLGAAILMVLTFFAAVSLVSLVRVLMGNRRRRRDLESRLGTPAPGASPHEEAEGWVPRPIAEVAEWGAEATKVAGPIARMIERAGWKIHVGDFLAPALLAPMLITVALWFLAGPIWAALGGIVALCLPFQILARAGRKRVEALQAQLPDVLMVLASSLRAGHSFLQALDSVAKEVDDPAATEFARALAEIQLGRDVDDALDALAWRTQSTDLTWAVTAIAIQRKVGGNLAEVLETVANTIRQREQLRRQVKVLSTDGRISVYILMALPLVVLGYFLLVTPKYLEPLTSSVMGTLLLVGAGFLLVIGYVIMRKIVRFDV